jgi:hypothetical protein
VVEQMAPIIMETGDQKLCAQYLADEFAHASREDVVTAINVKPQHCSRYPIFQSQ